MDYITDWNVLAQILFHLISNAVKFSSPNRNIRVAVAVERTQELSNDYPFH